MDSSAILLNSLLLKELGCHAAAWKRGCNRIFQIWSVPACYGGVKQSETVKSVDWIITEVIYQLQKVSENPGWKENGTRLFGSFQRKISGREQGSAVNFPNGNSCSISSKPSLLPVFMFQAFAAVFKWKELICTNGKRDFGAKIDKCL